jgi:Transposase DDE domain group 1
LRVDDAGPVGLDHVEVAFDDEKVVSDAGIMLLATLTQRLGIQRLVDDTVLLSHERPGAVNAGRKVLALLFSMVLGGDCIDDARVLRCGRTNRLLGWMPAPSTLGTFLRAFTFGHVRQLERVLGECLTRAWAAGAGPGAARLVIDVDSFIGEVFGYQKQGAGFGYTKVRGLHPILATRAGTGEVLQIRLRKGAANTQRGMLRFTDELIARVDRAGATAIKLLRADNGFPGEISLLTGQRVFLTAVVRESGRVVRVPAARVHEIIGQEPDLSELILRALLARHARLTTHGPDPDRLALSTGHAASAQRVGAQPTLLAVARSRRIG